MTHPITRTGALTPGQRTAVEELVARAAAHDGVQPLNEAGRFTLAGHGHAVHWLAWGEAGQLVGYAQGDRPQVQMVVAPEFRRRGIGRALADVVLEVEEHPYWWAFGNLPGAQHLAASLGATLQRELLIMELDMTANPPQHAELPENIELRTFTREDADRLIEVNSEAFHYHPEQGDMSLEDFWLRTTEPWFDPDGLLLAFDDDNGALVGFHWTKVENADPQHPDEPIGEVYVIAVAPQAEGRGIGRALLHAGLVHMADKGVRRVRLYVEADRDRVVRMYQFARFVIATRDAGYQS